MPLTQVPANMLVETTTLSATQATTSGTSIDFTGIPSWAKRVVLTLMNVSTNGTSLPVIQLGSGTIQTTGYGVVTSAVLSGNVTTTGAFTTGFAVNSNAAAASYVFGTLTLTLSGTNVWTGTINMADGNGNRAIFGAGNVTLAGALDRIRLTTVNGTDVFDAGSANVMYD